MFRSPTLNIPVKSDDPLDHDFDLQLQQIVDSYQEQVQEHQVYTAVG